MGSGSVAGRMIRVALLRQGERFGGPLLEAQLGGEPLRSHLRETEPIGALPGDDDEIDTGGEELGPEPEALTTQPFDPVAPHGRPDPTADHEPESRLRRLLLRGNEEREMGRAHPTARTLCAGELRMSPQPAVAPELERHYFL
jgi:hypothetical protein